ncbi:hypothetical protein [Pseudaestuariivita sp.]|uniref:hypothetical protein n=1 Tax=Pseudaestuariivita sp. TaxID=2211669 RepID=UPI004058323A
MSTADTSEDAPKRGPGSILKWILALQVFIGLFIVGVDIAPNLATNLRPSSAPNLTQPVLPGDQTRRYRDDWTPNPGRPSSPLQTPGDMPSRLLFTPDEGDASVLTLTGKIREGDAARFAEAIAARPGIAALRLHSPGGSVRDALDIGRQARELGLNTIMQAGDICLSACPYLFAGGVARSADEDASIGVHQSYFGSNSVLPAFLAVSNIQRGQGEVMTYLAAMGVDVLVMQHALVTPPDEIYLLLPEELERYRMVTSAEGAT